ncbi:right-handed parallel beta-helix repeat-containing protein [Rhizobium puerariae]|uniref:Right-handed parallel beta-helix repeat-containing protein n=1 Tax=Rhizobium puerariae TaxID=1585791 RepID=A0ABV6ALT0_9HYPH
MSGLCLLLSLLLSLCAAASARAVDFEIQVVAGDPARDIQAALREARKHRSAKPYDRIVINLPPHLPVRSPIRLTGQDSGRAEAPLVLRGALPSGTSIDGSVPLAGRAVRGAEDIAGLPFPASLAERLRVADLSPYWPQISPALTERNSLKELKRSRLFLFRGPARMHPSRWPEADYARNPDITSVDGAARTTLYLPDGAPNAAAEPDLWIGGFWSWNWWYEFGQAQADGARKLTFAAPENRIGTDVRYFLANVAQTLSEPDSYYVDRTRRRLFYIAGEGGRDDAPPALAITDSTLVIDGASHISLEGIGFQRSIGSALSIKNSRNITVSECYAGQTGGDGIEVIEGQRVTISGCVVDDTGYSGITLLGGNRQTLAASNHAVVGSSISRFGREMPSYRPGVRVFGVAQTVRNNEIFDGPHSGIHYFGNDHTIEGNILHDLVLDTDDAGAIYSGRNWTSRGTTIRNNVLVDVRNRIGSSQVRGVYLDDQLSGINILGNVFQRVDEPVLIGGGRDNLVEDNLFLDPAHGIRMDSRGTEWQADMVAPGGALRKSLQDVPSTGPLFMSRYPGLATVLTDRPGQPANNRIIDNLGHGDPLVVYEPEANRSLGTETGTRRIDATGDFPAILDRLDPALPALPALRQTAAEEQKTRDLMKALRFRQKLEERAGGQ